MSWRLTVHDGALGILEGAVAVGVGGGGGVEVGILLLRRAGGGGVGHVWHGGEVRRGTRVEW